FVQCARRRVAGAGKLSTPGITEFARPEWQSFRRRGSPDFGDLLGGKPFDHVGPVADLVAGGRRLHPGCFLAPGAVALLAHRTQLFRRRPCLPGPGTPTVSAPAVLEDEPDGPVRRRGPGRLDNDRAARQTRPALEPHRTRRGRRAGEGQVAGGPS